MPALPDEPPLPADFRVAPGEERQPLSPKARLAIRRARRLQHAYAQLGRRVERAEVRVPPTVGAKSTYDEVRERAAFDWPLVSVAAVVLSEAGVVKDARVVLGAVAPIPWRPTKAEQALVGKALDETSIAAAARGAITGAALLADNGYKVGLVRRRP